MDEEREDISLRNNTRNFGRDILWHCLILYVDAVYLYKNNHLNHKHMMLQLNIRADMLYYSKRCEGIDATNGHKLKDQRQKHEPGGYDTHTHTLS